MDAESPSLTLPSSVAYILFLQDMWLESKEFEHRSSCHDLSSFSFFNPSINSFPSHRTTQRKLSLSFKFIDTLNDNWTLHAGCFTIASDTIQCNSSAGFVWVVKIIKTLKILNLVQTL